MAKAKTKEPPAARKRLDRSLAAFADNGSVCIPRETGGRHFTPWEAREMAESLVRAALEVERGPT